MCLNTSAVEAVKKKKEKGPENGQTATQERIVVYSEITVICMRRRETEGGRDARERVAAETARARALLHAPMGERTRDNQHVFVQ